MKKLIVCIALIFIILIGSVSCYASVGTVFTSKGDFEYEINEWNEVKITKYIGKNVNNVVIPSEIENKQVTYIGENAFKDVTGVTEVTVPNTVAVVDKYAFANCKDLKTLVLGEKNYTLDWRKCVFF